jgi:hypothetical protein
MLNRLARVSRSLERGLDAIDVGDSSGFDDVLRSVRLLVLSGRGNRLLFRVSQERAIELRPLAITRPPEAVPGEELPLVFGLGGIPADGIPQPSRPMRPRLTVTLSELLKTKVLHVDGSIAPVELGGTADLTWEELLGLLANKTGAMHADDHVPTVFDEVLRFGFVSNLHPLAVAVRSFGVSLLRLSSYLLGESGLPTVTDRSLGFGQDDLWVGEFHWYGRLGGLVKILINTGARTGSEPLQVRWERDRSSPGWP